MKFIKEYAAGLVHLVFPKTCLACSQVLLSSEKTVCYNCISKLEPSRYSNFTSNEIVHIFDGNVRIHLATAGFRYHKEGLLQQLIFQLKYHSHKEIGDILGYDMGYELRNTAFQTVDYLIPVPLHPKKQRKRGYNQSEYIARGIGKGLEKETLIDVLKRKDNTVSQTQKNRLERFENVENVFIVTNSSKIEGKHILLIDDVVTTGSTLMSCVNALYNATQNITISIACLAKAD